MIFWACPLAPERAREPQSFVGLAETTPIAEVVLHVGVFRQLLLHS
jgi:hypothetical protein